MKIIKGIYRKSYWIALICIIAGFLFMSAGNTSFCSPNSFIPLTLAPCSLLAGYSFIVVGIMKRPI